MVLFRRATYLIAFVGMVLIGSALVRTLNSHQSGSDASWAVVQPAHASGPAYDSLAQLAADSDLIVVGTIAGVDKSREWIAIPELVGDPIHGDAAYARFAKLMIEVERSLRTGAVANPLEVEVTVVTWDELAILRTRQPTERALFFLTQKDPPDDPRFYRLTTIGDAVVRDVAGKATPLLAESRIGREVAEQDFGTVVEAVSSMVVE